MGPACKSLNQRRYRRKQSQQVVPCNSPRIALTSNKTQEKRKEKSRRSLMSLTLFTCFEKEFDDLCSILINHQVIGMNRCGHPFGFVLFIYKHASFLLLFPPCLSLFVLYCLFFFLPQKIATNGCLAQTSRMASQGYMCIFYFLPSHLIFIAAHSNFWNPALHKSSKALHPPHPKSCRISSSITN